MRGRHIHQRDTAGRNIERRRAMIAEVAYFHAERRGFEPRHELDDWLQAEMEIYCWLG